MKIASILAIYLGFGLAACSGEKTAEQEKTIEPEQITKSVVTNPQREEASITGRVEVSPNARISIHVPITSYVEDILVKVGDHVKRGQVLAYIEHPDILKLQEDYITAKSDHEVELENYNRKKELYSSKSISRKEFLESEKVYASSKARLERLSAELRFTGISSDIAQKGIIEKIAIKSPSNGIVANIESNKGRYMAATDEMMTILDTKEKWIVFQVFTDQLRSINEGDTINFHTSGVESDAIVRSISSELSSTTKGAQVICTPVHQEGLNVGEMVYGKVTTKQ